MQYAYSFIMLIELVLYYSVLHSSETVTDTCRVDPTVE